MSQPELVRLQLDGEEVVATINLSGDDQLVVTPSRSLIYEAEGLISDESVREVPHTASRLELTRGRRKVKITFEYPIEPPKSISFPRNVEESTLHYVLAGVLNATGVTESGEAVRRIFRFNELTLVITSHQLIAHVGSALWDDEYDQYPYDDISGIEFEEGSVATQIVLYVGDRSQRIKAPNDRAEEVKQEVTAALLDHYEVNSIEELDEILGDVDDARQVSSTDALGLNFAEGLDPIEPARETDDVPADVTVTEETSNESAPEEASTTIRTGGTSADRSPDPELVERLAELEEAIEQQRDLLDAQAVALESLAEQLLEEDD